MKLTYRSEYALLALAHLARANPAEFVSVESISEAKRIPRKFMEQIMQALKRAHYVKSARGKQGGYCLAKPANKISLAEIIRLFDGALAPTESVSTYFYESTPIEKEKKLIKVLKDVRDYVAQKMEATTLADVI